MADDNKNLVSTSEDVRHISFVDINSIKPVSSSVEITNSLIDGAAHVTKESAKGGKDAIKDMAKKAAAVSGSGGGSGGGSLGAYAGSKAGGGLKINGSKAGGGSGSGRSDKAKATAFKQQQKNILGRQQKSMLGKNTVQNKIVKNDRGKCGIRKAAESTSKATKTVKADAKKSIKALAKVKTITTAVANGDMTTAATTIGKSGIRLAAEIGATMIKLAVKTGIKALVTIIGFLVSTGMFFIVPFFLLICVIAGTGERSSSSSETAITGGSYEYVSYSQTKYEKLWGNGENGWCGLTAYSDALASMGCKVDGSLVTPYYVRKTGGNQAMSVNGWCKTWVNSRFPEVEYEAVTGYTRDWIDEKLAEGKMVGIYLSPRAKWKKNYTGRSSVTNSAHWILIIAKVGDTEYACMDPANGSADSRYVSAENTDRGSVGVLTIDLSGITDEKVPSASSSDIRIHAGDSGGAGAARSSGYAPPAFAMGLEDGSSAAESVNLTLVSGNTYRDDKGNTYESLGSGWTLTAYCPCSICCGDNADGITASGSKAIANHTIAVDTSKIPLGSKVVINGVVYTAEDTGSAIKYKKIDIYMNTHQEALDFGKKVNQTVYIRKN